MSKLDEKEIRDIVREVLIKYRLSDKEIEIMTDVITDAELCGRKAHGLVHLPRIIDVIRGAERKEIKIIKENEYSALIDGMDNLGPVAAKFAMDVALKKAKKHGLGIVGTHNGDPYLLAGYYAKMAAKANMIGIILCNSRARITPWGGIDPIFGVNPISIAFPSKDNPIVLDMAVSKITISDIKETKRTNSNLPPNCAIDKNGAPTIDPEEALNGALLPIDEHKGYGLALAVELLAGPLVNAKAGKTVKGTRGYLFLVIDPKIFVDIDTFEKNVSQLIREIKTSRKKASVSEILLPGERSQRAIEKSRKEGVDVDENVLEIIKTL